MPKTDQTDPAPSAPVELAPVQLAAPTRIKEILAATGQLEIETIHATVGAIVLERDRLKNALADMTQYAQELEATIAAHAHISQP